MKLLIATLAFILGTSIGSFLSVVIYRIRKKTKGTILGRSFCPECKKQLKWRHLIPVFSWIFLRGKCGYCGKRISSHYIILELTTGLLFLALFLNWNFIEAISSTVNPAFLNYTINWKIFEMFLFQLIEATFLIAIFFYDLLYKEIPDRFSLPAMAIAIAGVFTIQFITPITMLIGGLGIFTFFLLQFLISKGTWIGGGDLRLGALIGFLLGWQLGILALIVAYILGSLISIVLLMKKEVTRKTKIPFGPFLVTGTLVAIFFGEQILNWYFTLSSIS